MGWTLWVWRSTRRQHGQVGLSSRAIGGQPAARATTPRPGYPTHADSPEMAVAGKEHPTTVLVLGMRKVKVSATVQMTTCCMYLLCTSPYAESRSDPYLFPCVLTPRLGRPTPPTRGAAPPDPPSL